MFFVVLIICLIWFHVKAAQAPSAELWFMLGVFGGLAYIAGFLDSRIFARWDRNNGDRLAQAEAHYEQSVEAPEESLLP